MSNSYTLPTSPIGASSASSLKSSAEATPAKTPASSAKRQTTLTSRITNSPLSLGRPVHGDLCAEPGVPSLEPVSR
jgi:hypothetical protein